jgi:hypothetical protein
MKPCQYNFMLEEIMTEAEKHLVKGQESMEEEEEAHSCS